MDYSCEEADSESESIELHALELPLETVVHDFVDNLTCT